MLGKSILLYTPHRTGVRRIRAGLSAAGNEVITLSDVRGAMDLILARAVDLVLVDDRPDAAPATAAILETARGRVPVVTLCDRLTTTTVLDLVCGRGVQNVLARIGGPSGTTAGHDPVAVVTTAEKVLRNELFGLKKYLPGFGVELIESELRGAADRDAVVAAVAREIEELGGGRTLATAVATITDELVTNAIYNAPVGPDGTPRYASVSRREKIELEPHEYVRVEYGSDGGTFGIAVTDAFGALTGESLGRALERCLGQPDPIEQKAGGAGIGLYTVLHTARELVLNVESGRRTEAIALVDLDGRARRNGAARSLHVFFTEPQAAVAQGIPERAAASVMLSDTMRIDLRAVFGQHRSGARAVPVAPPRHRAVRRFAAVVAPMAELARGARLEPLSRDSGLGTAIGLIRGATGPDTAVATALQFLGARYQAAVVFGVNQGVITARCASGEVVDWARLQQVTIEAEDPCSLAGIVRSPSIYRGRPRETTQDRELARLTAGFLHPLMLLAPVVVNGEVRCVLFACGPTDEEFAAPFAVEALAGELEAKLARVGLPAAVVDPDASPADAGGVARYEIASLRPARRVRSGGERPPTPRD
jgi:hypothetical protein